MKDGCIFSRPSMIGSVCELHLSIRKDGNVYIKCKGSVEEKKKCPEWSKAFTTEEYYKKRIKSENKI